MMKKVGKTINRKSVLGNNLVNCGEKIMSSNNNSNEVIDLLSEIIINFISKMTSTSNTDKFKKL